MYPFIRLALTMFRARRRPTIAPGEISEIPLTCWPWDCDIFIEMNNGRQLTLYDLGRFDYGARTRLMTLLKKNSWGLVVAGTSVRYRKRLLPFQRFTMRTKLVARDERWFYFLQSMWRGETCHSSILVRTAVTAKGRVLPTQDVADALDASDWRGDAPGWVQAWIEADDMREWPPSV